MTKIIGIDVGTTAIKAAVLDADGTVLDRFSRTYPTRRSGRNTVEQDPEDWVRLIREALDRFAGAEVAAIGLCSQVNTHVFTDADGRPLMPAILWQDGRAGVIAATLDAGVTRAQKQAWWGAPMPIDASHAISRMAWVAQERPEIWARTARVLLPKDYCLMALTGRVVTDPVSNIGLVGSDLGYVAGVLDLVPGAADRVAPLSGIAEVAGTVTDGPFAGVPVVTGTMDAWAGLVGTGGAREGTTVYLSGTSEILGISSRTVVPTPGAIVFPEAAGIRLHAAPTQSGGDAARWVADLAGTDVEAMAARLASLPRSAATPLFLPQLDGERAPLWDADLRGAFLGLTRQTSYDDMARAVFEGVAFSARHALGVLQTSAGVAGDRIACGGGGFRSPVWSQIRADVLGVRLDTLAAGEPGILGAATFAALGAGLYDTLADASAALATFDATYLPDPETHAAYDTLYDLYREALGTTGDLGKRIATASQTLGDRT